MNLRVPARTFRRSASRSILLTAAGTAVLAMAWTSGCRLREPVPVDPVALQEAERRGAELTRYRRLPPMVSGEYSRQYNPDPLIRRDVRDGLEVTTGEVDFPIPLTPTTLPSTQATTQPATRPADQIVYLPLRECIRRATMNNFAVAVAGYAPAIAETRVTEALARFDPTFRSSAEYQRQYGIDAAQNLFTATDNDRLTVSSALSQLLPSGGTLELEYRAIRNDNNQASFFGPPAGVTWTSDIALQLTQPVLRDFGFDVNRARIFVNRNDQRISILEFRRQLEDVLIQVEETYWQLYQAQQLVEIRAALLARTLDTARRIEIRRERDATRIDAALARAAVKNREQELILATSAAAQLSDQLKALINDPNLPIGGDLLVLAGTDPVLEPLLFDLDSAVATAMLQRPELSQQQLRIINAGRVLNVAESNRLPRLDLLLRGGFSGLDDDYPEAVRDQVEFDNFNAGVGFQFEIPLGNRAARAILARSKLERELAVTQYQQLLNQIKLEVSQTQRQVSATYAGMLRLREATLASRDAVEQSEVLERSGTPLTPQFLTEMVRYLAEYSQALSNEQQAIAEYNIAIARYERAKGTLLRYNNVVVDELPSFDRLPWGRAYPPLDRARRK